TRSSHRTFYLTEITNLWRDFMDNPPSIFQTAQECRCPRVFRASLLALRQFERDFCEPRYQLPPKAPGQGFLPEPPMRIEPDARAAPQKWEAQFDSVPDS